jgi:uncharacterized protein (DUF486 family)
MILWIPWEDRFQDYSLLIFEEDKLIAVLPANRVGETVYSHQGLTYGGLVYKKQTKLISLMCFQLFYYFKSKWD